MNSRHIDAGNLSLRIPHEVAALIAALQLSEPNTELLSELSDQAWCNLLDFCDLAHLTLVLAQLPADGFPHWVVERLNTNVIDNIQRFKRVKATYKEAAEALSAAGVEHIVLKGFTQCPDYVGLPGLRFQSDLDLYCPAEMIDSARIALQTIGYRPDKEIDYSHADHTPTMIRPSTWMWRENHFDPEMPLSIELHFCLWNEKVSLFRMPHIDRFWGRRTTRVLEDLPFPCLSPVDQLGYLALHILRNVLAGDWVIHHVRELAAFLHSRVDDDIFWKTWYETNEPGLRSFEAITFYYARAWFGCNLPQRVESEIANLSSDRQRWLRHLVGSSLEGMFHPNKDRVWLQLSFLDSHKAKLNLLRRTFVPIRISAINSPAVRLQNRRPRLSGKGSPRIQYLYYLASRCASYSYLSLTTVMRGLLWRFSGYQPK